MEKYVVRYTTTTHATSVTTTTTNARTGLAISLQTVEKDEYVNKGEQFS